MTDTKPAVLGAVVVLLVVVPVLGIDLQLPAMPDIGRDLGASVAEVQLTLSLFTIVFAIMQLLYGALGDRYGRRRLLIASMALYAFASLYGALAPSIEHLIAARVLQAVAACAGPVLGRAVVRDLYDAAGAGRVLGTVMACFGIAALSVPILGGQLVEMFGWRATYFASAGYGVLLLVLVALLLPETLRARTAGGPGPGRLVGDYLMLLGTPQFLVIAATGCLIQGAMFTWISGSSFAVITVLGRSPSLYSVVYAITVFGFALGSFGSSRVIARVGQRRLIALGGSLALTGSAAAVGLNLVAPDSLVALVAPMFVVAVGHGFTLAQAMAGTMAAFPHLAGTASALFGFMQYLMATIVVIANGLLYDGTALPMLIVSVSCAATAMLCFALFGKHVRLAGG